MAGGLYKITVPVQLNSSETCQHGFHVASVDDLPGVVTIADGYVQGLGAIAGFKALFPTSQIWGPAQVQFVDSITGKISATQFGTQTWTGTGASNTMPVQCSEGVTLRTALAGPQNRGRMYLPPMIQTVIGANGLIVAANVTTALNAIANAMIAAAADGATLVVWSNTHKTTTDVIQVEIDSVVDTQRRRAKSQTGARQSHLL